MIKIAGNYFIFYISILLLFSCKKEKSNDCLNNPNYVFMNIDSEPECYSNCFSIINDNNSQVDDLSDNYKITSSIFGYCSISYCDTLPSIMIIFPGKTVGTYFNDNIHNDLNVDLATCNGIYSSPFYNFPNSKDISQFDLEITNFSEKNQIITGRFSGVLYKDNSDSILITNGEFKSVIHN